MKSKRVGSVTLGICLVVFGVLFLLSAFVDNLDYFSVIKFWPVVLISLGIEMLVYAFSKNSDNAKLDVPACILTCVLMLFSMCMAAAEYAVTQIVPRM